MMEWTRLFVSQFQQETPIGLVQNYKQNIKQTHASESLLNVLHSGFDQGDHYTIPLMVESGTDKTNLVNPMSLNLIRTGHDPHLEYSKS